MSDNDFFWPVVVFTILLIFIAPDWGWPLAKLLLALFVLYWASVLLVIGVSMLSTWVSTWFGPLTLKEELLLLAKYLLWFVLGLAGVFALIYAVMKLADYLSNLPSQMPI